MILTAYNHLSKCYFQYQSVFKPGRHQQSLNFDLGMESGIFAQRTTVDQAWESLLKVTKAEVSLLLLT